ncbi:ubiquinol oxidase subunit II [Methylomonas sp. MgM2]
MKLNAVNRFLPGIYFYLLLSLLAGCNLDHVADLNPSGPISRTIDVLFWTTVGLMSLIILPVFGMTAWFGWKYRASNTRAPYTPEWAYSKRLEWLVWLVPGTIIAFLACMSWEFTHRLAPYKPINAGTPLQVQAIAMDWKWLFVYPEQGVAAVNELVIPVNRPIAFKLTSNSVMNSFFIPRLAGQINAMAGMETHLHLIADKPGRYFGENIQFSGEGFPYQHFLVNAVSANDFRSWIASVNKIPIKLDMSQFSRLAEPSVNQPVIYFGSVAPLLFESVIDQFSCGQRVSGRLVSP